MEGAKDNTTMKKIYIEPKNTVVALRVRDNVMINASGDGNPILGDGGGTQDMGEGEHFGDAREVIDVPDAWEEW